ncbi:MAG TPA: CHASE2 domain-containing protein, partial [Candidatus Angelobacter sp.]|nr:CHASE2 domain-containing protein [Candidatus Angelobacter sp.]
VALVLIDDATLARFGRWPWPRHELAQLIRAVTSEQPKAVGIDILLPEAEDPRDDGDLAAAIAAAPNAVLATKISASPQGGLWSDPLPLFARAAKGVGHVQAIVDDDGLCRSIPLEEPSAEGPRPAFALKLAELVKPRLKAMETPASSVPGVEMPGLRPLIVDYRQQIEPGRSLPFFTVTAGDLLSGKTKPQLAGKAVLIGFGSVDMSDRMFTPVTGQLPMPGVEVNANALQMLLDGIVPQRPGLMWQFLLLVATGTLALWLVVRYPGVFGLLLLAGMLLVGYFASYLVFVHWHRIIFYGPLLLAGVFAAPIAQVENLLLVNREISARLRHLQQTLRPDLMESNPIEAGRSRKSSHLHWKLAALSELQAELSSLYSFHQTLIETMREGLAVYGADGKLRFGNPTWNKFCEKQSASPENLSALARLKSAWPELAAVTQAGGSWLETELPLGEELWHLYAVPLPWTSFAQDGAVMLIAEDITARKQRDQARSEALSFVTHELRTPLIAIQGFSELLMRYPNSPASSEAPATIFRESNRLVAMINTYLEVLRLDAGARPLRMTRASVQSMAEHVEKIVRPLAAAAHINVALKINCPNGEEHVICDETLIAGALLNLVSNAIKYGVKDSQVTVTVAGRGHEVEFSVHNSGPAIPASDLKQIFERFYRPSRSESIPGWGLGLSFVRRICQQHGGRVEVRSDENSGTSFMFVLPRGVPEAIEVAR